MSSPVSDRPVVGFEGPFEVHPVGRVESPLGDREQAPKQGDEGAPDAWIVFERA